jgi:DNA-binding transcriptional ArsR family regulator
MVPLFDVDPDLALGLEGEELERAQRQAVARTVDVATKGWDPSRFMLGDDDGWLGLLVLDGLLIRKVTVGKRSSCELFGPNDLVRPWDSDRDYRPLVVSTDVVVLRPVRMAILDSAFALRMAPWPSVTARLVSRVSGRARYLALTHAVGQLRRIDSRLLILFWLLAERWGKVGLDGVRIRLPLTHEVLAMLVGAHRPTVTLALARLNTLGLLTRERPDSWWLSNAAIESLGRPDVIELPDPACNTH